MHTEKLHRKYRAPGFSLVELLVVIAVISIMFALLMPAVSGFSSTAGRRGAINSLMNAFEEARVAAVENGTDVYVLMKRSKDPNSQDAFLIARTASQDMGDATTTPTYLTAWKKLPSGIHFYPASVSLTTTGASLPASLTSSLPGQNQSGDNVFGIGFNKHGQVIFPAISGNSDLILLISESIRSLSNTDQAKGASLAVTERLSFRRYTGRAQLDFAAPPSS